MARKKVVRKSARKSNPRRSSRSRSSSRRSSRATSRRSARSASPRSSGYERKFTLAWKNFVFFAISAIIFFVLYEILTNVLLQNFFWFLAVIFGSVAAALLIAFIILGILKSGKK